MTKRLAFVYALAMAACIESDSEVDGTNASAVQLVIEGESMSLPAGTGLVVSDAAASGGQALLIWSNATATRGAVFPVAPTQLVVRARGDKCRNISPRMVVTIDGQQALAKGVGSTTWASYSASLSIAAGPHTVAVAFTNDLYRPGECDRNLYVDSIAFLGDASTFV